MANTQSNLSVLSVSRNISSQTFHNGFKQVTFSIDVEFLRANKFNYELYTGYDNKIITGFKYKNEIQNNKINLSYLYLPGNYNVIIKLILDDDHDILSSLDLHVPSLNDDTSPMIVKSERQILQEFSSNLAGLNQTIQNPVMNPETRDFEVWGR